MINPAVRVNGRARISNILTQRESRFETSNDCCASSGSRFHRHGVVSGFVHRLMGTSKPPVEMPADANNIDITSAGGKYATRTNTIDWSISEKRSRKFADGSRKIWLRAVCLGRKCSRRSSSFSNEASFGLAMKSMRVKINRL